MSPSRTSAVGEPIGVELRWKASCAVMAIIVGGKTNSICLSPFQKSSWVKKERGKIATHWKFNAKFEDSSPLDSLCGRARWILVHADLRGYNMTASPPIMPSPTRSKCRLQALHGNEVDIVLSYRNPSVRSKSFMLKSKASLITFVYNLLRFNGI